MNKNIGHKKPEGFNSFSFQVWSLFDDHLCQTKIYYFTHPQVHTSARISDIGRRNRNLYTKQLVKNQEFRKAVPEFILFRKLSSVRATHPIVNEYDQLFTVVVLPMLYIHQLKNAWNSKDASYYVDEAI